jgi:hypothetical protein
LNIKNKQSSDEFLKQGRNRSWLLIFDPVTPVTPGILVDSVFPAIRAIPVIPVIEVDPDFAMRRYHFLSKHFEIVPEYYRSGFRNLGFLKFGQR